ncbi:hypothetical protein NBRC111894_1576 [Sporolactobacillus inulinus]|uniref:Uncharacterized protein n=1 Tax=Sporolactobacillus inulinus TaxID=2078 RepID=A0A4Y1ZAC6_9BACL|nr:hypothetical protein NBRC111894_1576 [Sporolactobacillus inulinus]
MSQLRSNFNFIREMVTELTVHPPFSTVCFMFIRKRGDDLIYVIIY